MKKEDIGTDPIKNQDEKKTKTAVKPKQLVEATYLGYLVGRGEKAKVVDPNQVFLLASRNMPVKEMALWFGVDDSTFARNFKDEIEKGKAHIRQSIRDKQIEVALNGDKTMLVWLGKNMLQQADQPQAFDQTKALPWSDDFDEKSDNQ